jgi:hypothetical protein
VTAALDPWVVPAAVLATMGLAALIGSSVVVLLRSTKNEIIADQERRITQLEKERAECRDETAVLRGTVETLRGDLVREIAQAAARAALEAAAAVRAARSR